VIYSSLTSLDVYGFPGLIDSILKPFTIRSRTKESALDVRNFPSTENNVSKHGIGICEVRGNIMRIYGNEYFFILEKMTNIVGAFIP
jgi:hypothetical protein